MLSPFPDFTLDHLTDAEQNDLVPDRLLFFGYRGSIAHGMFRPSTEPNSIDDKDVIGVYVGPLEHYLGFGRADVHERFIKEWDAVSYEVRKIVSLLLKGNPNVLSLLWLDPKYALYEHPLWREIRKQRSLFVSKAVYHSFTGYAYGQLKKMTAFGEEEKLAHFLCEEALRMRAADDYHVTPEHVLEWAASADLAGIRPVPSLTPVSSVDLNIRALFELNNRDLVAHYQNMRRKFFAGYLGDKRRKLVEKFGWDTKNGAHCIRLLRMSVEFLTTGELIVERPDAAELLAIKDGEWSLDRVHAEAKKLLDAASEANEKSTLPELPDRDAAELLLRDTIMAYYDL